MKEQNLTQQQAHQACEVVLALAKVLFSSGYTLDKPLVPGCFRYGLYAKNKSYWEVETWQKYFDSDDQPLFLTQNRYLGDFVIDFDSQGKASVIWHLNSPLDESGLPNTSHCEVLRELAISLNTTIRDLFSDKPFNYDPIPW